MVGIRKKKSRRNATIKITKGMRKKKKIIQPSLGDKILHEHWDKSKTLKQNMKDLGISYDSNATLPVPRRKIIRRKDMLRENRLAECGDDDVMDVEKDNPVNTAVVEAFEAESLKGGKIERHIAPGEAKFLMELISSHGQNYKKMSRDKRNTYQHTSKQLQRKCEGLLKSSQLTKYKTLYPGLLPNEQEIAMET